MLTPSSDSNGEGGVQAVARLRSLGADGAMIAPFGSTNSTEAVELAIGDFPIVLQSPARQM